MRVRNHKVPMWRALLKKNIMYDLANVDGFEAKGNVVICIGWSLCHRRHDIDDGVRWNKKNCLYCCSWLHRRRNSFQRMSHVSNMYIEMGTRLASLQTICL